MSTRWSLWRRAILAGAVVSPVGAILYGLPGFLYVTAAGTVVAAIMLDVAAGVRRRYGLAGAPAIPTLGFLAWGVLPTFFASIGLASGPVSQGKLLFAAFVVAWWVVAILLVRGVVIAILPALALMALPWGYVVLVIANWAVIALHDYGLKRVLAAGNLGMYLTIAALMGFGVFVPLTVIAVGFVRAFWRESRGRRDLLVSASPRSVR